MTDDPRHDGSPAAAPDLREFQLPSAALAQLHAAAGPEALEAAGKASGSWLAASLRESLGEDDLSQAPTDDFWEALDSLLASRGWGRLRQERLHSGLGVVVAEDWVERAGDAEGSAGSAGSPFSVGLLTALFGEVAGAPVRVMALEAGAEEGGEATVRFLFGSPAAVDGVRAQRAQGHSEAAALAAL